jgi:hypothetical protein
MIPANGMAVRIRGTGSLQVRCGDPGLLIAQFVGLPFDHVNDGIVRSVSRSVERMLARLLTRRVVMAGSPAAVTDPAMLPNIIEELVAYNPAAGAVFGVELVRMGHLAIYVDDGSQPWPQRANGDARRVSSPMGAAIPDSTPPPSAPLAESSGEIPVRRTPRIPTVPPLPLPPRHAAIVEVPPEEPTRPGVEHTPIPRPATPVPELDADEPRGAIIGIGTTHIGHVAPAKTASKVASTVASGEIGHKIAPGQRVLVPGPDGLMQSATVRQLLQGYYELEVGGSGETIWVPMNGVVPE